MKKSIAFFDFDGTITTRDTLLEFIKYVKGTGFFYTGMLICLPYLVAFKLKLISNQIAKERVLTFFFKGTPVEVFQEYCHSFNKERLPALFRPRALEEIKRLKFQDVEIVVVSASPENWIRIWTDDAGITLIASCLEVKEGKLTGRLEGKNCHGIEKVNRISSSFEIHQYKTVYAYGDSRGDLPMMELAHEKFYKPFT